MTMSKDTGRSETMKSEDKATFVNVIGNALKLYSREPIGALRYFTKDSGQELVQIEYESGNIIYQDVTADSCLAIMHDLYKALL